MDDVDFNPLLGVCHYPSPDAQTECVQRAFDQITSTPWSWVIDRQGEYIGDIRFLIETDTGGARSAELEIFIRDSQQLGRGFGTESINLALQALLENSSIERIELNVWNYNRQAIRSYEKCGFVPDNPNEDLSYREGQKPFNLWMHLDREQFCKLSAKRNVAPSAHPC